MIFDIEKEFSRIIYRIFSNKLPKKIVVAVSGGLDSMALLLLFKNVFHKKIEILCLTVDHNIRQNSHLDARFVADFCAQNSLNCTILKSYLTNPPEVDIEGSLREVRYNLLTEFCIQNQIKHLFVAHHQQDLAENFLIRLFRGSGIDGLAAMSEITKLNKINLVRPLLEFSKTDLQQYLQAKKINWVEDETNQDEKFLRNKIRKFLQTLPDFAIINSRISLASTAILEAKNILEKQTKKQFPQIFETNKNDLVLDVKKFAKLEKSTATRYLALAFMKLSARVYKPRLKKLERIYWLIIENKLAKKEQFYGCQLNKLSDDKIIISKNN
ncbi:MAG: tRNA lysidine(34) synthetase TilS [Pseudomonadota bacterium]